MQFEVRIKDIEPSEAIAYVFNRVKADWPAAILVEVTPQPDEQRVFTAPIARPARLSAAVRIFRDSDRRLTWKLFSRGSDHLRVEVFSDDTVVVAASSTVAQEMLNRLRNLPLWVHKASQSSRMTAV